MKSSALLRVLAVLLFAAAPAWGTLFLYVTDSTGALRRSGINGNGPSTLEPAAGAADYIVADDQHIYLSYTGSDLIQRINLDGTGLAPFLSDSDGIANTRGLARVSKGLAIADGASSEVLLYDFANMNLQTLVNGTTDPRGLACSGRHLYVLAGNGDVFRHDLLAGDTDPIAQLSGSDFYDLDVLPTPAGDFLYVSAGDDLIELDPSGIETVVATVSGAAFCGVAASTDAVLVNGKDKNAVYRYTLPAGPLKVLHDATSMTGLTGPLGLTVTPIPYASVESVSVFEDEGAAVFEVTLSNPTSCQMTVNFATADDTAVEPSDYEGTSGVLVFPPGTTSQTVSVPIVNDGAFEPNEEFFLNLTAASPGGITTTPGVGTILSESTITGGKNFAWGQNIAWTNWRASFSEVHTLSTFLNGYIWNQNVGWICLGNGVPADSAQWANDSVTDFGVNVGNGGALDGFAWGQNIGWVTFEQTHGVPAIDCATGRFSGYAWSQNCGWINLGTGTTHYVQAGLLEIVDGDGDGIDDGWELQRVAAAGLGTGSTAGDLALLGGGNFDGDQDSDLGEFLADTDPFDALSRLEITDLFLEDAPAPREVEVTWTSSPSRLYDLEESTTLQLPFASILTDIKGETGTTTRSYMAGSVPGREFWRVTARRPLAP